MTARKVVSALAGICTGASLAFVAAAVLPGPERPVTAAKLVPDTGGALESVCIQYRMDFHEHCFETIRDFVAALPGDVRVNVVVAEEREFEFLHRELERSTGLELRNVRPIVAGMPVTPWAKDRFGTMRSGDRPVLAVPPLRGMAGGARANDEIVPRVLCHALPRLGRLMLPFMFEGGDLLSDEENVYVTATLLERNEPQYTDDPGTLLEDIARSLDRTVITIGSKAAELPAHHVGMYLTPLGGGVLAAADPDLGLRLYKEQFGVAGNVEIETDGSRYEPFRNVIRILEGKGFRVVRVPMVLTEEPGVYVTYNNAILERRDGRRRIYMPVYDIPALDAAAARVFQAEGWQVMPVSTGRLYRFTGSLRCIVGVISRR